MVTARAWGPGAAWLLDRVPALLGDGDDWSALDLSAQPRLRDVGHVRPGLRLPATGLVLDSLVPAVLEQRVTGREAWRAWRLLLRRFGRPAPGPAVDMRVLPSARTLLDIPSWDWHRLGVDAQRQRAIRAAATVAVASGGVRGDGARRRLWPGCGSCPASASGRRPRRCSAPLGHPDAVSVGDYHLKDLVVHFLTGRPRGDDAEMLRLLEPWAGQRQRVVRLIELSGVGKPRFGPRHTTVDIRAI